MFIRWEIRYIQRKCKETKRFFSQIPKNIIKYNMTNTGKYAYIYKCIKIKCLHHRKQVAYHVIRS